MAAPTGWDGGDILYINQQSGRGSIADSRATAHGQALQGLPLRNRLREFIRNFRRATSQLFPYRTQLIEHYRRGEHKLEIELEDLHNYDQELLDVLLKKPDMCLAQFEIAATDALKQTMPRGELNKELPEIQVLLKSRQSPTPLRQINAHDVDKLLLVPGIVTAAHTGTYQMKKLAIICTKCQHKIFAELEDGVNMKAYYPQKCAIEACQSQDSYTMLPDACRFIDCQLIKVQEAPEEVPTGEMPRSVLIRVERALVDQVSPGTRVKVMGIYTVAGAAPKVKKGGSAASGNVRASIIRAVGLHTLDNEIAQSATMFTPEEEQKFHEMARSPDIYERIARSISPAISGDYTHDIKKAIACLLFGGSRRFLPDGMKLRGDINVLLLGDPSTAKSQFLKFVEKVAPIGVYTSGKGSSAAGLTASVVKDSRGEYYLEGGAMVLADGGVVCIDEFDKMREQDRVAIHEAMEQQTISIAKAGITTILNSRTAVLAAANPVAGTFDDLKSAAENIDFPPTILSRFDLIFIVRDHRDPNKDRNIARHVIGVHMDASLHTRELANISAPVGMEDEQGDIDLKTMKKYIKYCKQKCAPVLSQSAAELLRNHYVNIRDDHRKRTNEAGNEGRPSIPLTIRQLEAIIRIAESIAKIGLNYEATTEHVMEAMRLFRVSTLQAASTSASPSDLASLTEDQRTQIELVKTYFKRRVPIGYTIPKKKIMDDFIHVQRYSEFAVRKALQIMVDDREIKHCGQQRVIKRIR